MLYAIPGEWAALPHVQHGEPNRDLAYEERICSRGIVVLDDGTLLMTTTDQYGEYVFPGGGSEASEALAECLVREVMEETGYLVDASTAQPLCVVEDYRNQVGIGLCVNMVSFFFVCKARQVGVPHLDEGEKRTGLHPEAVSLQAAIGRNEELLSTKRLFWVERDTMVLKMLGEDVAAWGISAV